MAAHTDIFLKLNASNEGGLITISNKSMYMCRICQMTPDAAIKSEQQWLQHLLSNSHQGIHRSHQLLRKVLWNLDHTIAITKVMGINKSDILNYISQSGNTVVDFSYLSSKDGGTDGCYALMSTISEVEKLSKLKSHGIKGKSFYIRLIDDKEKSKHSKWRAKLLEKNI